MLALSEVRKMAQQLGAFPAFPDNPSLDASTQNGWFTIV